MTRATPHSPRASAKRWLVLLAALLLLGITLRAGFWQLQRAHDRESAQQRLLQRTQAPILNNAEVLALVASGAATSTTTPASVPQSPHQTPAVRVDAPKVPAQPQVPASQPPADALELAEVWLDRSVRLHGRWQAQHTVWLDNRSMDGKAGFYVITPLALTDSSRWVWVQRGWVPRHVQDRRKIPDLHTSAEPVLLEGRLAPRVSARFELGSEEGGAIRQNLALAQMQAMSAGRSLPFVVIQTDAAKDGLLRNWPLPASGADKNRAYAAQWFGMAALIMGLYVWFQLIGPLRRHR